ncbi:hypothetical protein BH11VER1_BH11VER1_14180 [soil metagenome]
MPNTPPLPSALHRHFFAPIAALSARLQHRRSCPSLSDHDWLHLGICRVLETVKSGRNFLQSMQAKLRVPTHHHFFAILKSPRRLALCQELNTQLTTVMSRTVPDAFADFPALDGFDLYAADGHSHAAASHDAPQPSSTSDTGFTKFATSHIYALNLRTHALSHLAQADQVSRRKEHEIRTLKRLTLDAFRQGALMRRKTLYLYDSACIDYDFWHKLKRGSVYFITRMKSNTSMLKSGSFKTDLTLPVNAGVLLDEQVGVQQIMLRHVQYRCPKTKEVYDFLTNEMTIPPGLIARLYQMRWDIEKVYDEVKNKCHEQKAWASSVTAKAMQAQFICLAHNLMVIHEHQLKEKEGVVNTNELKRKAKRLEKEKARLAEKNEVLPVLQEAFQRLTQRSVKYIRWLRAYLFSEAPWYTVINALKVSYASF